MPSAISRALEPLSKLGCAGWVTERVVIGGLAELDDDRCYGAMDWLLEVEAELAEQVSWSVATLLDPEGRPAGPEAGDDRGWRPRCS